MEPYNRFLSRCTKTGGYKKSEDGEFPATGGPPVVIFILFKFGLALS